MQNWLEIGQELCSNLFDLKLNFPLPPSVHICEKCRELYRIWNILWVPHFFRSNVRTQKLESLISWQRSKLGRYKKKIPWQIFFLFVSYNCQHKAPFQVVLMKLNSCQTIFLSNHCMVILLWLYGCLPVGNQLDSNKDSLQDLM